MTYFNSMKVRLEQSELANNDAVSKFQFHEGTIGTLSGRFAEISDRHFNSMKVRLELAVLLRAADPLEFQFHEGTIGTPERRQALRAIDKISIP